MRVGFAAVALVGVWRPRPGAYARRDLWLAALFGIALAGMNVSFYSALNRVPLGIAVTVEFVGPLCVALAGSRRLLDLAWVVLAGAGILCLAPIGSATVDPVGLGFALLAGFCWAAYIYLSAQVGAVFVGGSGLAIAMVVGTLALLPIGVASAGRHLIEPGLLVGGSTVAVLSSLIPYSLEMEALRTMPTRVFGVLMSLEPAAAAILGFVILRQVLGPRALAAIVLVTAASLGASRGGNAPTVTD